MNALVGACIAVLALPVRLDAHAAPAAPAAPAAKLISITMPWVAAVPPSARVSAAYMKIENHTREARTLVGASSPGARLVEIHEMKMEHGMMKMARVPRVVIPAQGVLELEPGGLHLMLIDLEAPLRLGDTVSITLHFAGGLRQTATAKVQTFEGR